MVNRYILEGIASDLEGGARIGVYVAGYQTAINLSYQIFEYSDEYYTRLLLSRGTMVHDSGGEVFFITDGRQAQGRTFDVLVVPHDSASEFPLQLDPRVELIEY